MSGEGPESIPTSADPRSKRPTKKRALTPVSEQAATVTALFAKPDQEIRIPPPASARPNNRRLALPPEIVTNVQGSSAGAGSGEFHVYKASRRRENERLRFMDEDLRRETADKEFEAKKRELEGRDEEKTRRNREKRERKKNKRGAAARQAGADNAKANGGRSDNASSDQQGRKGLVANASAVAAAATAEGGRTDDDGRMDGVNAGGAPHSGLVIHDDD